MNIVEIILIIFGLCCCCYLSACSSLIASGSNVITIEKCDNLKQYCDMQDTQYENNNNQQISCIDVSQMYTVDYINTYLLPAYLNIYSNQLVNNVFNKLKLIITNNNLSCKKKLIFFLYVTYLLTVTTPNNKSNVSLLGLNKYFILNTPSENILLLKNTDSFSTSMKKIAYFDPTDLTNNTPVLPNIFDVSIFANIISFPTNPK
jgi:hypothetical protein